MPHDVSRSDRPQPDRTGDPPRSVPASAAPSAYQATLLRIIESTTNDPAQLRRLVYELARLNLKRETWQANPTFTPAEVRECLLALETAIGRVESDFARAELTDLAFPRLSSDPAQLVDHGTREEPTRPQPLPIASDYARDAPTAAPDRSTSEPAATEGVVPAPVRPRSRWSPSPDPPLAPRADLPVVRVERPRAEVDYPARDNPGMVRLRRRVWLWFITWPFVQLAGSIVLSVALFLALSGRLGHQEVQTRPVAATQSRSATADEAASGEPSGLPLPTSYGVYAVSNGVLSELETLPIRAPDPRIMLSAEITKPSTTLLPDGKVAFVVFRRDLVNSAPQKATVRVVARVARAMTFDSGKAAGTDVQGAWRIRSNSYEFNVAPVNESREMVAIRPETADFALPAGRYALVLNGVAYDFTVDGPVTDAAQCLESVAAVTGTVYTECGPN